MSTDRVRTAPIANHHEKDLTAVLVQGGQPTKKPRLSATLAEGSQTVKLTAQFELGLRSRLGRGSGGGGGMSPFESAMKENRHRSVAVVGGYESGFLHLAARDAV
jgi:hypothetical protein